MEKKLREKGLSIAKRIEEATKIKTEVVVTSSGEMLFHFYCYNNYFDYAIIKVYFEEDRTDLSYLKEIYRKIENYDYYIYKASELEKEVIRYIKGNKVSNAWVYEGELHVEIDGIELDPIDLKYYDEFNIEIDEYGELELTIKYEYDNKIYIVNNDNEIYVEEYDKEGNECCIYCHKEFFDECTCDSVKESECKECKKLEQEIKELNEIIKEKDELIGKLKESNLHLISKVSVGNNLREKVLEVKGDLIAKLVEEMIG